MKQINYENVILKLLKYIITQLYRMYMYHMFLRKKTEILAEIRGIPNF